MSAETVRMAAAALRSAADDLGKSVGVLLPSKPLFSVRTALQSLAQGEGVEMWRISNIAHWLAQELEKGAE